MPIHKVSSFLGKWENDHFPKRLPSSRYFFFFSFPSIFWFPNFAQNNFKSLAKLFELTPQEKKIQFFPPQKITKWWKSAKNKKPWDSLTFMLYFVVWWLIGYMYNIITRFILQHLILNNYLILGYV